MPRVNKQYQEHNTKLMSHGELKNKNSYIKFETMLQDGSVCMCVSWQMEWFDISSVKHVICIRQWFVILLDQISTEEFS